MIAIYAEKPDMGTKIAAALFGIPLENGVVVTFSQAAEWITCWCDIQSAHGADQKEKAIFVRSVHTADGCQ